MNNLGLGDEFLDTKLRAWIMQEKKLIKVKFTKIKKNSALLKTQQANEKTRQRLRKKY